MTGVWLNDRSLKFWLLSWIWSVFCSALSRTSNLWWRLPGKWVGVSGVIMIYRFCSMCLWSFLPVELVTKLCHMGFSAFGSPARMVLARVWKCCRDHWLGEWVMDFCILLQVSVLCHWTGCELWRFLTKLPEFVHGYVWVYGEWEKQFHHWVKKLWLID